MTGLSALRGGLTCSGCSRCGSNGTVQERVTSLRYRALPYKPWRAVKCGRAPTCVVGALDRVMLFRRCPTLPHPPGCSTIGAVGLSFRVRNGTGRFPHAMTAVTFAPHPWWAVTGCGGWEIWLQLWCCYFVVFSSNGFVGWEPHSGRKQSCFLFTAPWCGTPFDWVSRGGVWCKLSAY
jgi:hypothetical protein